MVIQSINIGPSGLGKVIALLKLIQEQNNDSPIDNTYYYAKDLSKD